MYRKRYDHCIMQRSTSSSFSSSSIIDQQIHPLWPNKPNYWCSYVGGCGTIFCGIGKQPVAKPLSKNDSSHPSNYQLSIKPQLGVGAYEGLLHPYCNCYWLDSPWVPQLWHAQKTVSHSFFPHSSGFYILSVCLFHDVPCYMSLDRGEGMTCTI